jgi:hypothetical protein
VPKKDERKQLWSATKIEKHKPEAHLHGEVEARFEPTYRNRIRGTYVAKMHARRGLSVTKGVLSSLAHRGGGYVIKLMDI